MLRCSGRMPCVGEWGAAVRLQQWHNWETCVCEWSMDGHVLWYGLRTPRPCAWNACDVDRRFIAQWWRARPMQREHQTASAIERTWVL